MLRSVTNPHDSQAIIAILRAATQKAAELLIAGQLITREKFHDIIIQVSAVHIGQAGGLVVQQLTYLETPDDAPYVNIFITNNGDIYRCNIFLYPMNNIPQKAITIRIEVDYEDWGTENRFR